MFFKKRVIKYGLIGIRAPADSYYDMGDNTGNTFFTEATKRQLKGDVVHIGHKFKPEVVRKQLDVLVIPAANWIRNKNDLGWLADLLDAAAMPTAVVGLGAQIPLSGDVGKIPEGTIRFLDTVSHLSSSISVRGSVTANLLDNLGYKNLIITGCPSIYYNCAPIKKIKEPIFNKDMNIAFHSTRYFMDRHIFDPVPEKIANRLMFQTAYSRNSAIIFQSEMPEIKLLLEKKWNLKYNLKNYICKLYGTAGIDDLESFLRQKGQVHLSVDDWVNSLERFDFMIGTRIHGTIAGLLAKVPSLLVYHDQRTKELSDFMGIPNISAVELNGTTDYDLQRYIEERVDLQNFLKKTKKNIAELKKFYADNGIHHNL